MHKDGIPIKSSLDKKIAVEVRGLYLAVLISVVSCFCIAQHGSLASHITRKTESGLQDIDQADSLVSIWATSINKEVSRARDQRCVSLIPIEFQILITKEDSYILVVTKKLREEKYDHEDCKYCEQFHEGKI